MKDLVARETAEAAASIAGQARDAAEAAKALVSPKILQRKIQEALAFELGNSTAFQNHMIELVNQALAQHQDDVMQGVQKILEDFYNTRIAPALQETQGFLELINGDVSASRQDATAALQAVSGLRQGLAGLAKEPQHN